ncbi:DHHW family protein [Tissierella carlieri]|uniref:DHHW family protein n=1 Tax=Tissierella carlieri TaxID=689904 RepID=A0ABT1S9C0_9FIRM|nr:DHHW family protein [Tissierella carlieri]MCQ4923067.1 DHHW family protein [Tissierella carlieri]
MKKFLRYKIILIFLLVIFAIPILTAMRHNVNVSNIENRTLAPLPQYSNERLLNGEYFSQWENYISDHIIGRDYLIKSYTLLNMKVLGKHKINNIIIGKEDTLLPFYTEELSNNLEDYLNNLNAMTENMKDLQNHIKSNGGEFYFVGLPGQSSFFRSRYQNYFENKEGYFVENENKMFNNLEKNNINYINMNEVFKKDQDNENYLKTDHHFSFKGSYKTYVEIIDRLRNDLGLDIGKPLDIEELDIVTLDKPILGSRNRQLYFLHPTDEKVSIAYPRTPIDYEKYTNGVLDPKLYYINNDENPSYNIYMGGDQKEIIIDTNREDLPNLLIFGDSFTNALEPLLYYHFNETRILDLRHYKEMNLYEYIDLHKPTVVLMIRDDLNYGNPEGNGKFQ